MKHNQTNLTHPFLPVLSHLRASASQPPNIAPWLSCSQRNFLPPHRFTGSLVPLGSQVASPWILCEAVGIKVTTAEGNNCKQKIIKERVVLVTRGLSRRNGSKSWGPQDSGKDKLGMKYSFSRDVTRNMINFCILCNYLGT